jgi:hypothetical protein
MSGLVDHEMDESKRRGPHNGPLNGRGAARDARPTDAPRKSNLFSSLRDLVMNLTSRTSEMMGATVEEEEAQEVRTRLCCLYTSLFILTHSDTYLIFCTNWSVIIT